MTRQKLTPEAALVEEPSSSAEVQTLGELDPYLQAKLERLAEATFAVAELSISENTKAAYRSDWLDFLFWTDLHRLASKPADAATVAMYITDQASSGAAMNTVSRRLAAIGLAHRSAELEDPTKSSLVRKTLGGLARTYGRPEEKSTPIVVESLRAMLAVAGPGLKGTRDRALLLIGFAGAFRRSELVALDLADVRHVPSKGLRIVIPHSKTDQDSEGEVIGIPYGEHEATCPVTAFDRWLQAARISDGAIFRSVDRHGRVGGRLGAGSVDRIVKDYADRAGLAVTRPGEAPPLYTAHSLRAGLPTSAAAVGVEERVIQKQTRHKSLVVLRGYIREGELFANNASGRVGL